MELREYCPLDCQKLARLFYETVHTANAVDYTPQQLDAWADGHTDLAAWNRSFLSHYTLVAQQEDQIIGFGDICPGRLSGPAVCASRLAAPGRCHSSV